ERFGSAVHRPLALEQAGILRLQQRQDELLLAAEVVVDLAERDLGGLGDRPRREVRVALRQEALPRGGKDRRAGLAGRPIAAFCARDGSRFGAVHDPASIRPPGHAATEYTAARTRIT